MKLSISNIGWASEEDVAVYRIMKEYGYSGLEIAPTRIFPEKPYDNLEKAARWSKALSQEYGFCIPSMQSIWYGRQERIFGTEAEQEVLIDYTKKAIDFAAVIGCKNLVFGCPKNRNVPEGVDPDSIIDFFRILGDYAASKGIVIGLEANPPIYHTNFINDTQSALELIRKVDSKGFMLNLDVGTILENQEQISELLGNIKYISHVHISEPGLDPIKERELHKELFDILSRECYSGFISIEMGKIEDVSIIEEKIRYIGKVFADE